jgi:predicted ATPase
LSDFPDGVYFVPLTPLSDPSLVPTAIAQPLGVQETGGQSITEMLKHFLREKYLLLVLDNFEHLLPAAPLVAELLAASPRLKVLATSRECCDCMVNRNTPCRRWHCRSQTQRWNKDAWECEAVALFMGQGRRSNRNLI